MRKDDGIRVRHMLDAGREALKFIEGKSRVDLDENRMLSLSLVKELEVIGEAASRISEETRRFSPDVPWSDIAGMRHRLIHGYFDINLDIVWQTIVQDLPPLVQKLERILQNQKYDPTE